jgi:hypothetical protein
MQISVARATCYNLRWNAAKDIEPARRSAMRIRCDWIGLVLVAIAIGCFVVGALPRWSDWVDPANGDKISEWRTGFWSSPSFEYLHREYASGGFETRSGLKWLSWSSLVILMGIVSWAVFLVRREEMSGTPRK